MRTRIKICGVTSEATARSAALAGADSIGLMFYGPSKRYLTLDQAKPIRQAVGPYVTTTGVFVDPDADFVRAVMDQVGVTSLQFHGDESAGFCAQFGLPYVKVIRINCESDAVLCKIESNYPDATGILLDTHVKGSYGGTGQVFDWTRAQYGGQKPVILAGGLTPENVTEAIQQGTPWGVDVSSGVETDGVKDVQKMRAFCQAVIKNSILN